VTESALRGADRRALRALGHGLRPIVVVDKDGISDSVVAATESALEARELVKGKVLEACPGGRREVARELAEKTSSELVQTLGRTFLLYRRNPDDPRIELPPRPAEE